MSCRQSFCFKRMRSLSSSTDAQHAICPGQCMHQACQPRWLGPFVLSLRWRATNTRPPKRSWQVWHDVVHAAVVMREPCERIRCCAEYAAQAASLDAQLDQLKAADGMARQQMHRCDRLQPTSCWLWHTESTRLRLDG
jgi:hypothetical protein